MPPPAAIPTSLRQSQGDTSPPRTTRRRFLKRVAGWAALPALGSLYASQVEPFWAEFHEVTIAIPGLPAAFENFRIAHLTDLHAGKAPFGYLTRVAAATRQLKPDLVVATGDLIHHNANWVEATAGLLGDFPVPVLVSFGNHEFNFDPSNKHYDPQLPQKMESALTRHGCTVLRNRATTITRGAERLWFVGLDDLWFGDFAPPLAFARVPRDETIICLSHNPDTAEILDRYQPDLIIAGHTHGGQVRVPGIGAIQFNTQNHSLDQGLFRLRNSQLYVSRGIGYVRRVRFNCRPEVPVFRLIRAV